MRKAISMIVAAALVASVFTGCGSKTDNTAKNNTSKVTNAESNDKNNAGNTDEEKADEVAQGPKVWMATTSTTPTMNPHTYTSTSEAQIITYMSTPLLRLRYDKEAGTTRFIPLQAEALPTSDESKKVWTFKLRKGLRWEDGTPIDANSYVYSIKMQLDPKLKNSRASNFFTSVPILNAEDYFNGKIEWEEVGVKALDDYTLEFTLSNPLPAVDVYVGIGEDITLVNEALYEAGMNEDRTETTYGTEMEQLMSYGSYTMTEWIRDQYKEFKKVEYDEPQKAYFTPDIIKCRDIGEYATKVSTFEEGDLMSISLSGETFDKYSDDPRVVYDEVNTTWGFYMNSETPYHEELKDLNFRKALYYAMPRVDISKGIFKTFEPVGSIVTSICMVDIEEGTKYKETEQFKAFEPENAGTNVELAKEYFAKAYANNGNEKLEVEVIYFDSSETFKQMVEVMEEQYENLFGADKLDIILKGMPFNVAYEKYKTAEFDMGVGGTTQNAFNPWGSMEVYTTDYPERNTTFVSEKFDELYERTVKGDLVFKPQERIEALVEMEKIMIDNVAFIPVFQNNHAIIYRDDVELVTDGVYYPAIGFDQYQSEFGQFAEDAN